MSPSPRGPEQKVRPPSTAQEDQLECQGGLPRGKARKERAEEEGRELQAEAREGESGGFQEQKEVLSYPYLHHYLPPHLHHPTWSTAPPWEVRGGELLLSIHRWGDRS